MEFDSQETVAQRRWRENESIPVTPRSCRHEETTPPPMIPTNEDKLFMDLSSTSSIMLEDWSCDENMASADGWCLVHPQQGRASTTRTSRVVVAPRSTHALSSFSPCTTRQPRNNENRYRSDPEDTSRFLSSSSFSSFARSPTAKAKGNEKPSVHDTSSPTSVQACLSFAPLQRHDSWGRRKEDHQISSYWSDDEEEDDAAAVGVLRFCGEGEGDTIRRSSSPIRRLDLDLQSPAITDTPSRRVHPIPRIPNLQPRERTLNLYHMNMM